MVLEHLLNCFPGHVRLNAPDWFLSLKQGDIYSVVILYSQLDELRKCHKASPLPIPNRLFVYMDAPIGKYRLPSCDFHAITPYGCFRITARKEEPKGFEPDSSSKDNRCPECHLSRWPCEQHSPYEE